jgi:hypothetical protein
MPVPGRNVDHNPPSLNRTVQQGSRPRPQQCQNAARRLPSRRANSMVKLLTSNNAVLIASNSHGNCT